MAKAEKTEVDVVTTAEGVALHLTMAEVRALHSVAMCVGGSPSSSPRGLIDGIREALREAVGAERYNTDWAEPEHGCFAATSIFARDYPTEEEN